MKYDTYEDAIEVLKSLEFDNFQKGLHGEHFINLIKGICNEAAILLERRKQEVMDKN